MSDSPLDRPASRRDVLLALHTLAAALKAEPEPELAAEEARCRLRMVWAGWSDIPEQSA